MASLRENSLLTHQVCHQAKLVLLLTQTTEPYPEQSFPTNLRGCLFRDEITEALPHLLRAVVHGATWFSHKVVEQLWQQRLYPPTTHIHHPDLSERELQILSFLARGWDRKMIADEMELAEQTVRNYVSQIYAKLHVRSRQELLEKLKNN